MSVSINITELKETLDLTPSTQNIMLVGKHGIGKSEILTSYFNSKGLKVVTLFLGQMADPGDIIGIPSKVEKQDAKGKPPRIPTSHRPIGSHRTTSRLSSSSTS